MTNTPLVSVHIISYNQVAYIEETLQSALSQNYPNFEIVVADDGSTDGTVELIMNYADRYPSIIIPLVGEENLGITGNSNRALKMCKGKYIAFQGGDDLFNSGKLSAQVKWMEADKNRVLCGHEVEVFYDDDSIQAHNQGRKLCSGIGPVEFVRNGVPFQGTSIMIRSDAVPENGFDSQLKTYSDDLFFIEVVLKGGAYGYVDGVLARYRRHGNNISRSVLFVWAEWGEMFHILRLRYPYLKAHIDFGLASRVLYPKGVFAMSEGEYKKAISIFYSVLKKTPLSFRTYIRVFQCLLLWALRPFKMV